MGLRVAPEAAIELHDIWDYITAQSGHRKTADHAIEAIVDRFAVLARRPHVGRRRDDLRPGLRSFPAGNYVILYRIDGDDVIILRVIHGRRDLPALLGG
jgi:toxin ParE1/3/4